MRCSAVGLTYYGAQNGGTQWASRFIKANGLKLYSKAQLARNQGFRDVGNIEDALLIQWQSYYKKHYDSHFKNGFDDLVLVNIDETKIMLEPGTAGGLIGDVGITPVVPVAKSLRQVTLVASIYCTSTSFEGRCPQLLILNTTVTDWERRQIVRWYGLTPSELPTFGSVIWNREKTFGVAERGNTTGRAHLDHQMFFEYMKALSHFATNFNKLVMLDGDTSHKLSGVVLGKKLKHPKFCSPADYILGREIEDWYEDNKITLFFGSPGLTRFTQVLDQCVFSSLTHEIRLSSRIGTLSLLTTEIRHRIMDSECHQSFEYFRSCGWSLDQPVDWACLNKRLRDVVTEDRYNEYVVNFNNAMVLPTSIRQMPPQGDGEDDELNDNKKSVLIFHSISSGFLDREYPRRKDN